jgi:hypothetical protein
MAAAGGCKDDSDECSEEVVVMVACFCGIMAATEGDII